MTILIESLNQVFWKGIRHSRTAQERGFPESAHALLNESADLCITAIFALNEIERPHGKWYIDEITSLPLAPHEIRAQLREVLLTRSFAADEIERRVSAIERILHELVCLSKEKYRTFPDDIYWYWARFLSGRQVNSENMVDRICVRIQNHLLPEEYQEVRGALSLAALRGRSGLHDLFACAFSDGIASWSALRKAQALVETDRL
jgi:hypothetical protein